MGILRHCVVSKTPPRSGIGLSEEILSPSGLRNPPMEERPMDPPMFIRADRDGKRVTLPEKLRKRLAEGEGQSRVG